MATVKLYDPEDLDYELPGVCMVCGGDAAVHKARHFSWNPGWVYLLLFLGLLPCLIVALIMTKKKTVEVPLCRRHRNHWMARQLLMFGSFCGLILLLILGVVLVATLAPRGKIEEVFPLFMLVAFVGWLIFAVVVHLGMIRAREITDDTISLQGVSAEFKDALKEWRREIDDQEREREERRRDARRRRRDEGDRDRYSEDDFEEDRPRRPRDEFRSGEP